MSSSPERQICDYEGSAYRAEFWGQGRDYEDAVERVALNHLLPPTGQRLIDIGGGYGRLVPLYRGYQEVVIFDYALSQLRQAQELWGSTGPGGSPRHIYVAGDYYQPPFARSAFDTVVMVRALHHATDAPAVLRGISDILGAGGTFVLEFANKRNLKALLRYLVGRQEWSPLARDPVEFVPLNFDFHPAWIRDALSSHGLRIREQRAVSSFRIALLKRLLPTDLLVTMDRLWQPLAALFPLSPSVFVRSEADHERPPASTELAFRCTACGTAPLLEAPQALTCGTCATSFPIQDGIYNFRPSDTRDADT